MIDLKQKSMIKSERETIPKKTVWRIYGKD